MGKTLEEIAEGINNGEYQHIAFMVGAGISTSAGIPDFRSPDTGLYANLERLDLPYPEAVFDISYFRKSPKAFYTLADELYPGKFEPTKFHRFMKLTQDQRKLHRVYTQNIDTLERLAGIHDSKIIEAHGSFAQNFCIECNAEMSSETMKKIMWKEKGKVTVPRCQNKKCKVKGGGLVKPSIVFFGEALPKRFFELMNEDLPDKIDLVICAGTSLTVHPFANLPDMLSRETPRVLFNSEKVGSFGRRRNDVVVLGDCDAQIAKFCELLGWELPEDLHSSESAESPEELVEEIVEKLQKVELAHDRAKDQSAVAETAEAKGQESKREKDIVNKP